MSIRIVTFGILLIALQACSGNPAEFQGESVNQSITAPITQDKKDSSSSEADASSAVDNESVEEVAEIKSSSDVLVSSPAATDSPNSSETAIKTLTLVLSVSSTSVRANGSTLQATAMIDSAPAAVVWSVSAAGNANPGLISDTGLYTAPSSGGDYDVKIMASLKSDPSVQASISIKVISVAQIFVGCQQGNQLFPITANVFQLQVGASVLPDFTKIGAKLTTVCMDQYAVSPRPWTNGFPGLGNLFEWFALQTTTNLQIATAGTYSFKLNSDDGAKLYIDGVLLINNDGVHSPMAKVASINLSAGSHILKLDYFQGPRTDIALELFWKTPGQASYVYVPTASLK